MRGAVIPWVLLVLVTLAAGLYLYFVKPKVIYQKVPGPVKYVKVPKVVEKIKREFVPVTGSVEFFPKKELAEKMKMPEIEMMDDNVIAVGEVPKHNGKTTVLGTLNIGSDNVYRGGLLFRQEPRKFWEVSKDIEAEVWYLPIGPNRAEANIVATPLRTGPVEWKLKGGIVIEHGSGQVEAIAGIGLQYDL